MDAKARVLVVDDDPHVVQLLVAALTDDGYQVDIAKNGAEALATVRVRRPDLILLDLMMPSYSGWDFVSSYRKTPGPHAPVIVVTAAPESTLLGLAATPGVEAVVRKPFSLNHLLAIMRQQTAHPQMPKAAT